MGTRKLATRFTAAVLVLAQATSAGAETPPVPVLSDEEFVLLAERAGHSNLGRLGPVAPITGDEEIDNQIRDLAEARGYQRRPSPSGPLVDVDGQQLQPAAALAWEALKHAANEAGHSLRLVSGYRSVSMQVGTFLSGAGGIALADYEARLAWSAPPGYSKHHTGYVIDLALPGQSHNDFGRSAAYQWLVADNYRVLKNFGFVPSYPPGGPAQGPNPETWEYTFVGGWTFRCWRQLLFSDLAPDLGQTPDCPD